MPSTHTITRRVEFSDTDLAGIMHFSNFFRFMETAEHGFFRSLGLSIFKDKTHPEVGWPRVHAECDYDAPVTFDDQVEIHLLVKAKKSKDGIVSFTPYEIDNDSGIGTQFQVIDINGDGKLDIVTSNKKGTYIHLQQ